MRKLKNEFKLTNISQCILCKGPLTKIKKFPDIDHDQSHELRCENCPTKLIKHRSGTDYDYISYSYSLSFSTEKCDRDELFIMSIHMWSKEHHYGYGISIWCGLYRDFQIWYHETEPFYHYRLLAKYNDIPDIDFDSITKEQLLEKIKTYTVFS